MSEHGETESFPYKIMCIRSDDGTPIVVSVDEVCSLLGIGPTNVTQDISLPLLTQLIVDVATLQKTLNDFSIKYSAIKVSYDAMQDNYSSIRSDLDRIMTALRIDGPVTLPPPSAPKVGL